jgi:hypothetical protein
MSKFSCWVITFFRLTIASNILTLLNYIVFCKYIFIFWMKNPGSVHDDFWSLFISIWTLGFSIIFSLIKIFQPRK